MSQQVSARELGHRGFELLVGPTLQRGSIDRDRLVCTSCSGPNAVVDDLLKGVPVELDLGLWQMQMLEHVGKISTEEAATTSRSGRPGALSGQEKSESWERSVDI